MKKDIPLIKGCIVRLIDQDELLGEVLSTQPSKNYQYDAQVRWLNGKPPQWISVSHLRSGFQLGMDVQDVPWSRTRKSLGEGVVIENRTLGRRDQVLVEFPESGQRIWLPYQNLRFIKGARHRFETGQVGGIEEPERFRLRTLAYGLQMWNENTGALSKLDIDPLPHQIHLVHHILKSGNLNWLIADDVGLGKTIEVGMLLSALSQKRTFRRVLLVTPAGLVKQWKEELHYKFGFSDFRIYGQDFIINDIRDWKHYDHVIGSLDMLKSETHLKKLMQTEEWDLVVFDEAHRLSRSQYGLTYNVSDRFNLAAKLRGLTDSILLLSATPHQGKQDKFQALLEIIRPEWKEQIRRLNLNPDILREMVIRNNKADATDADGNFIFRGKLTKSIEVPLGQEEKDFDALLQRYITEGYAAGQGLKGASGRAIGFVMTIYRKLAASSIAAIERALTRRLHKLNNDSYIEEEASLLAEDIDGRFVGEWEEAIIREPKNEFFEGEAYLLQAVISRAQDLLMVDRKIRIFVDELVKSVLNHNPNQKILVFTEYRGTQDYIAEALRTRFGPESIALIHGGMTHFERSHAISRFELNCQFLISTEAGGEGINLQRNCHIMVNFDLPWNPMRLVQRVGRLYRYGQKNRVVVFNIHAPQTLDAEIVGLMYQRIQQVVRDMSILGGEYRDGLEDDILGEIADLIDIDDILKNATANNLNHTLSEITEAIAKARIAADKQRELFQFFAGYDPNETKDELKLNRKHLISFVLGMIKQLDIEIIQTRAQGGILDIRLTEKIREALAMGSRQRLSITFDRNIASGMNEVQMMDFNSPLLRYLIKEAKRYSFGGQAANLKGIKGQAIFTALLRWQNDQGMRMREEFSAALITLNGIAVANPPQFIDWLCESAEDGTFSKLNRSQAKVLRVKAFESFDSRLAEISNIDLHPENRQLITAGWGSD